MNEDGKSLAVELMLLEPHGGTEPFKQCLRCGWMTSRRAGEHVICGSCYIYVTGGQNARA